MLALFLAFLKSHWQTALIASGMTAVITALSVQHLEVRHYQNALKICRAEDAVLEASNKRLLLAVQGQNDAVAALQKADERKMQLATHALKAAQHHAAAQAKIARAMESRPSTGDECADLKNTINSYDFPQKR